MRNAEHQDIFKFIELITDNVLDCSSLAVSL